MTIEQFFRQAITDFRQSGVTDSAVLDAEVLLASLLKKPRGYLLAHPEKKLTTRQHRQYRGLIMKRLKGVPIAYLTGHKEFYGLDFIVNPRVLIPRPDTELLVEHAITEGRMPPVEKKRKTRTIVDVGTGSGCIAVTLAKYLPRARIIATDVSLKALAVARRNAQRHQVQQRVTFLRANLLKPLRNNRTAKPPFDIIVSNLPYLTPAETRRLPHEPSTALHGGRKGLELIEKFIRQIPLVTHAGSVVLMEIAPTQRNAVESMIQNYLPNTMVNIFKDLSERERVVRVRINN